MPRFNLLMYILLKSSVKLLFMINNKDNFQLLSRPQAHQKFRRKQSNAPNTFNRTQRFSSSLINQEIIDINRQKSVPQICEKKLKARILQILRNQQQFGRSTNLMAKQQQDSSKYNRSYMHHKVIGKPKIRQNTTRCQDSLEKIKNICETRLISLTPKTDCSITIQKIQKMDQLQMFARSDAFIKMCVNPNRKKKELDLPNIKNYKTQCIQNCKNIKGMPHIGPWEKQELFCQFNEVQMFS